VALGKGEFAVVKTFTQPESGVIFGDIVDFGADLRRPENLRDLFFQASHFLKGLGATKITTWAQPGTALWDALGKLGFVAGSHKVYYSVKVLTHSYDHLYDFSRWCLRQGDATNY
jgi:hypothetical protein